MSKDPKYIYFIGIGGIGMSALAIYFHQQGKIVSGYDKTPSKLTNQLTAMGIEVGFGDGVQHLPAYLQPQIDHKREDTLVVFTPAVPKENVLLNYFFNNRFRVIKRSVCLAQIVNGSTLVAVGGTHGKTTTSTLIAHIFKLANKSFTAILGGISGNYSTNLLWQGNEFFITEADEFDRSFMHLLPDVEIITSTDADHLDIYKNAQTLVNAYQDFTKNIKPNGLLIYKYGLPLDTKHLKNAQTYGLNHNAQSKAQNIRIENSTYLFDFADQHHIISDITCGLAGKHNIENAVAAIAVARHFGIDDQTIKQAVATYKGAKRRFEYQINTKKRIFIDDYAHHPTEIEALVHSVRAMYPNKKITGIFQPHLYSRTRDFGIDFAKELSKLDEVILLPIYPAREQPIENISSEWLMALISNKNKKIVDKNELINVVLQQDPEVLLTIGAGDIDGLVEPLANALLERDMRP